jgi:hypothetical protein
MDGAYFAQLAENFDLALKRLGGSGLKMGDDDLRLLQEKVEHCHARAKMRDQPHGKLALIAREFYSGRYTTAALGWKSLAQDLMPI